MQVPARKYCIKFEQYRAFNSILRHLGEISEIRSVGENMRGFGDIDRNSHGGTNGALTEQLLPIFHKQAISTLVVACKLAAIIRLEAVAKPTRKLFQNRKCI